MGLTFSKNNVVRVHGAAGIAMGTMFLLESLGIHIPLFGAAAVIPGFKEGGIAVTYMTRFLSSIFIGLGLYESTFYDDSTMHTIYDIYHYLASAGLLMTTYSAEGTGMNYLYAGVVTAFTIAGVVAKEGDDTKKTK